MDLISASDVTETTQPSTGSTSSLRAAVVDWLSARQVAHSDTAHTSGAEVCVAKALEREKRPSIICARLRRGVRETAVREAFSQCHAELADKLSVPVALVIEQQPIRHSLADEYCDIATNETAEHTFLFSSALRKIAERRGAKGGSRNDDGLLAVQLTEIAAAFPAARDSLEELLWQHRT